MHDKHFRPFATALEAARLSIPVCCQLRKITAYVEMFHRGSQNANVEVNVRVNVHGVAQVRPAKLPNAERDIRAAVVRHGCINGQLPD